LSLILPTHIGAGRLERTLTELAEWLPRQSCTELILVDDGSGPRAATRMREFASSTPGVMLLKNDRKRGKGFAVARGMLASHGRYRVFTDADLAYPLEEVSEVVRHLESGSDVVVACRVLPESRYDISPSFFRYLYTRHLISRVFNWLVRHVLLDGIRDTQAGLKGFTAAAADLLFRRQTVQGFGFDVELLCIARDHGLRVTQMAVHYRYDHEPSTLRFTRDAIGMLRDLGRIQWNRMRGRYR
jgi:dolichyl-phosphate beta-glucosyltransferase